MNQSIESRTSIRTAQTVVAGDVVVLKNDRAMIVISSTYDPGSDRIWLDTPSGRLTLKPTKAVKVIR
jgi:hypothetical protein